MASDPHPAELTGAYTPGHEAAETPAPRATSEAPGTRVGPYKLLQRLGEGGMGAVYEAEQERPIRRRVALKIIKPGMDSEQVVARFEAERQALVLMSHANIAKVLDGGSTEQGRTQFCNDQHLTLDERLELFIPVCEAIQHAHQKGVIHRDIKPSNILVTLSTLEGQAGKLSGPVHEVGQGLELRGQLDKQTPTLVYQVKLAAGKTYVIDMVSPDQKALDPYLILTDAADKKLAEDDDSGGGLNARIVFRAAEAGAFRIQATSFNTGAGAFTLNVREKANPPKQEKK